MRGIKIIIEFQDQTGNRLILTVDSILSTPTLHSQRVTKTGRQARGSYKLINPKIVFFPVAGVHVGSVSWAVGDRSSGDPVPLDAGRVRVLLHASCHLPTHYWGPSG